MKKHLAIYILILNSVLLFAQNDRKINRQGYKDYMEGDYNEAEIKFRTAEDVNENSFEARFNTGASLYEQEKYEETVEHYQTVINEAKDPESLSKVWHNIGNTLLESEMYAESIDAYKNSLRLNSQDMDTKYNLAYARQKLQEQQQQQQDQNQDQQNQDQNKDQENQDQKDQEQQEQDEKEQEQQQNQDQKEQEQKDQQQQAVPHQLSEEDAKRMLEAIMQQEKDVKEKVDKKKASARKVKTEKDW